MTTNWDPHRRLCRRSAPDALLREALGYVDAPPPRGWGSWEDWLRDFEVPEDERGDGGGLVDPDGRLPRLSFLEVPEGKTAKNRLHLDLQVSGGRDVDRETRRVDRRDG